MVEGGADILIFIVQHLKDVEPQKGLRIVDAPRFKELQRPGGMGVAYQLLFASFEELVQRKRSNRFQHRIARLILLDCPLFEQALVDQRRKTSGEIDREGTGRRDDRVDRIGGRAAREDAQTSKQCLLVRSQQGVAPGDRGA